MDNKARKEAIEHFFNVHGVTSKICLEPSEKCDQPADRAHSIPNSTVLKALAVDGHVIMPQMKLKVPPPSKISFELVGIKKEATTFTGLCTHHDNEIFRPIDLQTPDLSDPIHLFLLAYRAVLREYHACLQNALRFQSTYQKRVEVGISQSVEPDEFGMITMGHIVNAFECYEYKRQFDQIYLEKTWSQLNHQILVLKNQSPTIAVSSLFSLDDVDADETPRIAFSLFPGKGHVQAVFSSIPTDTTLVTAYLDRILSSSGHYQKYLLSKLILQSCDNFVISLTYYKNLPQVQKDALCKFLVDTIDKNEPEHDDKNLYLF